MREKDKRLIADISDATEDYESLIETLNILSDSEAMKALAEAEDDLAAERLVDL